MHGAGSKEQRNQERRQVQQPIRPAGSQQPGNHRESQAKVKKDGWSKKISKEVSPVHRLIKRVELSRIVKGGSDKRKQAKNEEVQRLRRARPAKVDKQSNGQVSCEA